MCQSAVEVESVSFLEQRVDVVRHSVLASLIEFEQSDVVVECRKEAAVVRCSAALDAESFLCILQLTYKSVVVFDILSHLKT